MLVVFRMVFLPLAYRGIGRRPDRQYFYMLRTKGACIEINSQELPPATKHGTIPIYCVSWIKQLLGLRGFILTPYQLFCALKRYGGTVIYAQKGNSHG